MTTRRYVARLYFVKKELVDPVGVDRVDKWDSYALWLVRIV